MGRGRRFLVAMSVAFGSVVLAALLTPVAYAGAGSGPALSVPSDRLDRSVECLGDVDAANADPVLLVPGTLLNPEVNFSWNYARGFEQAGRAYCTVRLPNHGMADIQVSAEYVVHALREVSRRAGGDVDVLGYSQGGMAPRWALKFWPDTRSLVDDLVGLDPSNYGTVLTVPLCAVPCQPALHQQRVGSNFLRTLNAGPDTYAGIDYTVIYTLTDEVVFPNFGPDALSRLGAGYGATANIAVQEICPVHVAEHVIMGTTDPVGYALAVDAMTHPGPASPARIEKSVCTEASLPGVDPAAYPANLARLGATVAEQLIEGPRLPHEPPLKPYARDS